MIKVSIIVPIYNVEEYLARCLDSLVHQTLREIEIILVNDASPDNSYLIMEEYREKYPNLIRCIYLKENLYQGGARNKGIEIATGEYITFVDSDDYVDVTLCEKLYQKAILTNSDIVGCDYYRVMDKTGKKQWDSVYYEQQMGELDREKRISLLFMFPIPVAKIMKRSLLIDNHLFFEARMKYEDAAIVPIYFIYAKRMQLVTEPLYYYRIREQSTSRISDTNTQYDVLRSAEKIYNAFVDRGIINEYAKEAEGLYIIQVINYLVKMTSLFSYFPWEEIKNVEDMVKALYAKAMHNNYYFMSSAIGRKVAEYINENRITDLYDEHSKGVIRSKGVSYICYYQTFLNRISEVFEYCNRKQYRVAIWGAGGKGNDFLSVCDRNHLQISYVIDNDTRKHKTVTRTGHLIQGFEQVAEEVNFIIIMNQKFYAANNYEIKKTNFSIKTLNLDLFILMKNAKVDGFIE